MRTKSFITRASLLILSLVLFIPESFSADMESYCVLPPYVKKGAIPNIMFLMDKSDDMLNPAYTDSYTPNTTIDNYKGYFKPQACYSYGSQKFTEKLKVVLATDGGDEYGTSYTDSDTCPSSAPFRGNLLNWATMSKFDILEKIIIGGNSVSKQGNAHSLLGIEGTWSKTYSGCVFEVNNGNLTISDVDTSTTCDLIAASPSPIALNKKQTKTLASLNKRSDRNKEMIATVRQSISPKVQTTAKVNEPTLSFSYILKNLFSKVARFFNDIEIIPQAYAAAACDITPGSLNATVGLAYNLTLSASGGSGSSNYSWIMSGVPAWLTGPTFSGTKNNTATWTGTAPVTPGNYTFTATIGGRCSPSYSESFTIVVSPAPLSIQTSSLNDATEGTAYSFTVTGVGGVTPYTWSAANLPPGLSICAGPANCTSGSNTYTPGTIYGTPTANGNYNGIVITVTDSQSPAVTASKTFSMKVSGAAPKPKSTTFNIKVTLTEEPLTDVNGNDIYDGGIGESYQDLNENGEWDGKQGVFQRYWDENNPKANWGLTEFTNQGVTVPSQGCIPASPQSSFLTAIENATGETTFPLSDGLYGIINYFAFDAANFSQYDADSYKGCNSQDPLDRVPCRKNFVLIISSGSDVTGSNFSQDDCVNLPNNNNSAALVENACFGFKNDLRSDKTGKQNILTYVVNALGTTNQDILEDTAYAGNGKYYNGDNPEELEKQLNQAFKDILARAASGTAASVLASGEGQGANLVQAVFYPKTQTLQAGSIFSTEISWIGRLSNFWYFIDPFFGNATMREETAVETPYNKLNLVDDYVASFYYDPAADQTKAARCIDSDGDGDIDENDDGECDLSADDKTLETIGNIWEAGIQLWKRDISTDARRIFTTLDGSNWLANGFTATNASTLMTYLQASTDTEAEDIINWTLGQDISGFRSRTVAIDWNNDDDDGTPDGDTGDTGEGAKVWKLGDILDSTPKISSWIALNNYHKDERYNDSTYSDYLSSSNYKDRGMVFSGGNDGMLHAFKLGKLEIQENVNKPAGAAYQCTLTGTDMACLSNPDGYLGGPNVPLGSERWAFIPKNALPYLKYMADDSYCHVYSIDLAPYIFDASIGTEGCTETDYADCSKLGVDDPTKRWRTILIGGMRFGGACRNAGTACNGGTDDCIKTPIDGVGYSSYFALDVTDQDNPSLLWEFSDPGLGASSTGPGIVRIGSNQNNNGKWIVVLASGPTGPIDTINQQFLGRSDQPLKIFALDLKTGTSAGTPVYPSISTSFAGSLLNSTQDTDIDYQDDVLYIPYVSKADDGTWTDGGVMRLLTGENADPDTWKGSIVIDGIGPLTSSVARLQQKSGCYTDTPSGSQEGCMWLYFATGRYYYVLASDDTADVDDPENQRSLFGIKEPCYSASMFPVPDTECDSTAAVTTNVTDIADVPSEATVNTKDFKGWQIDLEAAGTYTYGGVSSDFSAERVITNPLASTTGIVFFTTYKPYTDVCSLGGKSFIWATRYNTGGAAGALLKGKALLQVSTGSIEQVDLEDAFEENNPSDPDYDPDKPANEDSQGDRRSGAMEGVPPTDQGLSILVPPPGVKRTIHIRER